MIPQKKDSILYFIFDSKPSAFAADWRARLELRVTLTKKDVFLVRQVQLLFLQDFLFADQ